MSKKIILLILSITVVIAILAGTSYAVLFKTNETDEQVYTTGMLEITSETTNNSITFSDSLPMSDADGLALTPYTFKITNTGNLTYKFDVKLLATNTTNLISSEYIKVSVNDGGVKKLSELTDGIILSNQTLYSGESIEVSLRVWLDEYTLNTELGKQFYGKITTEGQAIYTDAPSLATLKNLGLESSLKSDTPDFSKTSCSSGCDETTVGVYAAEDDLGTSYYFRGNVENNYVKFADFYWRIIRINGDGSIRMIYDGTSAHANGEESTDRQISTSAYNTHYFDNTYVGYMTGTAGASDYAGAHSNSTDSTIKGVVDAWYKTNIVDTGYSESVVDAIYCNDRSLDSGTGIGATETYYGASGRLINNTSPTLKCSQKNDRFTIEPSVGSIEGNDKLIYPVGLITADELSFAGSKYGGTNELIYLYNGSNLYWTMSPFDFIYSSAGVGLANDGAIDNGSVNYFDFGVRPVITLSSSAIKSGNGTASKPFSIEGPSPLEATLQKLGLTVASGTPDFSKTSCSSGCGEATVGVYAAEDDLGTSYYFRGDVTNNYVKFADFYWRIIRINGDGTIRMIYDGTSAHANGEESTDRQIGTSAYNTNYNDNTYVGYMTGTVGASDYASVHSNTTDSTIKGVVDAWYKTNIVDKGYSGSVVDAIYCNDRSLSSGTGIGTTADTHYGAYGRLVNNTSPTLKCSQKNDRFTTEPSVGSIEGNDKLIYPVGLITADELSMAGTAHDVHNYNFYLHNGVNWYWTMSPFYFDFVGGFVSVGWAYEGASRNFGTVSYSGGGVRPVITLSSSAITGGTGISTDPYKTS